MLIKLLLTSYIKSALTHCKINTVVLCPRSVPMNHVLYASVAQIRFMRIRVHPSFRKSRKHNIPSWLRSPSSSTTRSSTNTDTRGNAEQLGLPKSQTALTGFSCAGRGSLARARQASLESAGVLAHGVTSRKADGAEHDYHAHADDPCEECRADSHVVNAIDSARVAAFLDLSTLFGRAATRGSFPLSFRFGGTNVGRRRGRRGSSSDGWLERGLGDWS